MVEVEMKIDDSVRNILERFCNITGNISENIDNVGECPKYDKTVVNLLWENFGATLEYVYKNNQINGGDDMGICID